MLFLNIGVPGRLYVPGAYQNMLFCMGLQVAGHAYVASGGYKIRYYLREARSEHDHRANKLNQARRHSAYAHVLAQ